MFIVNNWSDTATADRSATGTNSTLQEKRHFFQINRPQTYKQRYPLKTPYSRQQDPSQESRIHMYSDSGLGTAALDYAQSGTLKCHILFSYFNRNFI